jgi:hypothetical protein
MIEKVVILTLTSIGICCTMWHDMIFDRVGDWIERRLGEWWAKPLGKCYICTTFWVSIAACLILAWPVWLALPAMGLSAVISLFQND